VYLMICDPLSKSPTSLHNLVLRYLIAIEIQWVKDVYYINNFTHVLIASVNKKGTLELDYLKYH